eukprot:142594-Prorocentrum_minimum.AAC.2
MIVPCRLAAVRPMRPISGLCEELVYFSISGALEPGGERTGPVLGLHHEITSPLTSAPKAPRWRPSQ